MRRTLLIAALSFLVAAPVGAQQLKVSFNEGLVSVDANAVSVRQILNEWAKQGGTKVVGVERITGAPLTIKLIDVPESKALEVILRSVAGYMAAPRAAGTGASMYDRILVMATSARAGCRPRPPGPRRRIRTSPARSGSFRHASSRRTTTTTTRRKIRIRRIHRCSPSRSSRAWFSPACSTTRRRT